MTWYDTNKLDWIKTNKHKNNLKFILLACLLTYVSGKLLLFLLLLFSLIIYQIYVSFICLVLLQIIERWPLLYLVQNSKSNFICPSFTSKNRWMRTTKECTRTLTMKEYILRKKAFLWVDTFDIYIYIIIKGICFLGVLFVHLILKRHPL